MTNLQVLAALFLLLVLLVWALIATDVQTIWSPGLGEILD